MIDQHCYGSHAIMSSSNLKGHKITKDLICRHGYGPSMLSIAPNNRIMPQTTRSHFVPGLLALKLAYMLGLEMGGGVILVYSDRGCYNGKRWKKKKIK